MNHKLSGHGLKKRKEPMKRIVSILLTLCLIVGLFPAYAGETETGEQLGYVHVIVENTTFTEAITENGDTFEPKWTGTLVDKQVPLWSDSTVGSCVADAVTSSGYTQRGAEDGYISRIHGLGEFNGGPQSGWMVTLNDWFINKGVNSFSAEDRTLEPGDEIRVMYTRTGLGADLGSDFSSTEKRLKALSFSVGTLDTAFDPDTHGYILTVPAGTTEVVVTPTAMNKNYQVRAYVGNIEYKRSAAIPVEDGTEITVKCGDPSWPSMSPTTDIEPQLYSIRVETAERPLYTKPTYTAFPISGDRISKDCGTSLPYSLYRDSAGQDEIVATLETFDDLQFIPDNAASAGAVELSCQGNNGGLLWGIDFVGFGSGKLVYTDTDGVVYSVAIESVLPERGFSTQPTLTEESYMKAGASYTIGQPFYYVFPEGVTISSAEFTEERNAPEVPSCVTSEKYSDNVWQFTINGHLDTFPDFYLHVTFHTDMENELPTYGTAGWIMLRSAGLTQLGTPTELAWGREYNYSTEFVERPGTLSAKVTRPTQNQYSWEVYRVVEDGDDELVDSQSWDYGSEDEMTYIDDGFGFAKGYSYNKKLTEDWCIPSGTYYFKVCAEGDNVLYCDSEVAISDTWTYTQPEAHLSAPTGLYWDEDNRMAHWTDSNADGATWQFEIVWFFQKKAGDDWEEIGASWGSFAGHQKQLQDYVLERSGAGNYAFRVRALSPDITQVCNSVWSELSPVLEVEKTTEQVVESLGSIKTDYTDTNENGTLTDVEDRNALRREVAGIGTNSLSTAMAADTGDNNSNGTVNKIAELEKLVGGQAGVTVSEDMKDTINADKVSIIGANLNTSDDATATLQIGKAEKGEVIDEQYQNTITFSMELSNVEKDVETGHQQLAVPVQITIPVPSTINPEFLVILHHKQDGSVEEVILPRIVTRDGTTYAIFVITSFSDFTLAEQRYSMDGEKLSVPVEAGVAQVLAAVYGGNGQMLACVSAAAAKGTAVLDLSKITIADDAAEGAHLKVFCLDKDSCPMGETLEILF